MPTIPIAAPLPPELSWLDWSRLRCELIWIYGGEVSAEYLFLNEFTPAQSAFLIRRGGVRVETEAGVLEAGEGEWMFLNEGRRQQRFSRGTEVLSLRFRCCWPGHRPLFVWQVAKVIGAGCYPALQTCAGELEKAAGELFPRAGLHLRKVRPGVKVYLELQALFLRWAWAYAEALVEEGCVPERFGSGDERVARAMRGIDFHPLHKPFRETDLAREVNLSASQLGKLFAREVGMSPCRYYERRRLEEAMERLRHPAVPLKEIAADLGFSSLPHFSSWFRRRIGQSPGVMRQGREALPGMWHEFG